jgi:hypothetical protein
MWPFMVFLGLVLIAVAVIGVTNGGTSLLTVVSAVCLGLIVAFGAWTFTRSGKA